MLYVKQGRRYARVWTVSEIADHWSVTDRRVRALAKDRGIEGIRVNARLTLFTSEDVKAMAPRESGGAGHLARLNGR